MTSIFTRIIKGEIPSYKIGETEDYYAFLDINPLMRGHTLVIPKKEVDYLFDLDDETYQGLFAFAKDMAQKIKAAVPCERIGVVVMGMEVPHAHIHLIPINRMSDMDFSRPKLSLTTEEFNGVALKIREG